MQQRLELCHVDAKNSWNEWIYIDEKWIDLVNLKRKERYHDDSPKNKVRLISKQNTKKLIIICATARPSTEHKFDGLIDVWRILSDYQAMFCK